MAGTQGWTEETWEKLRASGSATGGRAAGSYAVKSCGKAHPSCNICQPDKRRGMSAEAYEVMAQQNVEKGTFAGANNPNWKGGISSPSPGWKATQKLVWERDKVCRACGLPPNLNRNLDVHHVISRRDGGTNDLSNLVGLHHVCHMKVEAGKMKISGL